MIFNLLLTSVVVIAGFYFSIKCFAKMGELTSKLHDGANSH